MGRKLLGELWSSYYDIFSKEIPSDSICAPTGMEQYFEQIYHKLNADCRISTFDFDIDDYDADDKNLMVGFSGGVDSTYQCLMLRDAGREHHCKNFAMGNSTMDSIDDMNVRYEISDSIQLFNIYNTFISNLIDGYIYHSIDVNRLEEFRCIYDRHPEAIPMIHSCISLIRYRSNWRKHIIDKYDTPILDGRCGMCYKCATEYIILADIGYYPKNPKYVKKCIDVMRRNASAVSNQKFKNMRSVDIIEYVLGKKIDPSK